MFGILARATRVVIADGDAIDRAQLRSALERGAIEVCAAVSVAPEAVVAVRQFAADVALVDAQLPGGWIQVGLAMRRTPVRMPIVVLASSPTEKELFQVMSAGASGYLSKYTRPEALRSSVRGVVEGELALPRTSLTRLVEAFQRGDRRLMFCLTEPSMARLSDREWEVLELLDAGLSTKQVAAQLFVAEVTVRSHIRAVEKKIGVSGRAAAVALLRQTAAPWESVRDAVG